MVTSHVSRGWNFPLFLVVCVFERIVPIGPGGFLRAVPTLTFMLILTLTREIRPLRARPGRH